MQTETSFVRQGAMEQRTDSLRQVSPSPQSEDDKAPAQPGRHKARRGGATSNRALEAIKTDVMKRSGTRLLDRWDEHQAWWDERLDLGLDPYCRVTEGRITSECRAHDRAGRTFQGVNFASQDYLGLASHPRVHAAAKAAIDAFGVHSAGSAALMGNTSLSEELERRLADFLGYADCTVFPTGWGAGYGVIKTLVGPDDHIVIDVLAHACLQEGARNATRNVHTFPHLSNKAVATRLERLRQENPSAGILVVTESLFSMDSDTPDIAGLCKLCDAHDATLLVDVAHDLGAIGPAGGGHLELQGARGVPDIVMGSFSKTFASNGGFVASNSRGLKMALRTGCGPLTFTNALSPVQAAIALASLDICQSPEGRRLRESLYLNAEYLRSQLQLVGLKTLGETSAIVPVLLGDGPISRAMTRQALENGALVNLVEYPAVSRNSCRWRIQVMATHNQKQIDSLVRIAVHARESAKLTLDQILGISLPHGNNI